MSAERPTLTDLRNAAVLRHEMEQEIIAALHAGGFTIPCDECEDGVVPPGDEMGESPDCPRCNGSGVLHVGILPAPVDEGALRVSIDKAIDDTRGLAVDNVMAVLREAGILPKGGAT